MHIACVLDINLSDICREYEDLTRSHAYLTDLVERQGVPVFNDIPVGLKCAEKALKNVSSYA